MHPKIEISTWTILKLFLVPLVLFFLWYVRDVLVMLVVVFILVAAFYPLVNKMESAKIPRFLAVLMIYLALAAIFALLVYLVIPPMITEVKNLANNLPYYINQINLYSKGIYQVAASWQNILDTVSAQLAKIGLSFYSFALSFFGGLAATITVIVLSFYLLLEGKETKQFVLSLFSANRKDFVAVVSQKIGVKIGGWLRGQAILSVTVGLANFIGLSIIGIPYALTLGVLAALLEIVPIVGPVISGAVAILIALATTSWIKALFVLILYIAVQQLESNLLVPKIMGKAVGLSPAVIIIALLIGGKLAGLGGAILAVPIAAGISVVFAEFQNMKKGV